jgi:hypothetical protein
MDMTITVIPYTFLCIQLYIFASRGLRSTCKEEQVDRNT